MIKRIASMNTNLIRNWMTPHPATITTQTTLAEAQQLMLDDHIRRLPVLEGGKLVGIVTWREINHAESAVSSSLGPYEMNLMRARLTANEFMSTPVVTISPDATIGEAAGLMMEHKISSLPVVENGKLVGLITEAHIDAYSFHDRELLHT